MCLSYLLVVGWFTIVFCLCRSSVLCFDSNSDAYCVVHYVSVSGVLACFIQIVR